MRVIRITGNPVQSDARSGVPPLRLPVPRVTALALAVSATVLACGCGGARPFMRTAPPATLIDPTRVERWEEYARPDLLNMIAIWVATIEAEPGTCPRIERSGTKLEAFGDCVADDGQLWTGHASLHTRNGVVRARFEEFGDSDVAVTGRIEVDGGSRPRYAIDARFDMSRNDQRPAGQPSWLAIDARGHVADDGTWQGEGELGAQGLGRVRVRGRAIALDDEVCSHEPLAGTLELRADGHEVVIRYDGASDCDQPGTALWWLDGAPQGELTGINGGLACSVGSGGRGLGPLALSLLLLLARRRSRTIA